MKEKEQEEEEGKETQSNEMKSVLAQNLLQSNSIAMACPMKLGISFET